MTSGKNLEQVAELTEEQRLRQAQKAGRIGSFEWLLKEQRATCTPELEALYGLPEGTFKVGFDNWRQWVYPEDADKVLAELQLCIANQQQECAYEFRAVLPNGKLRWLRGHAQLFYDDQGEPERMIGVNIDIDAIKQAEARLLESQEQLQHQWQAFDIALSNTPDFTYTFDLEGRFTYVNKALLSLWQKPLHDALGKTFFQLGYPPPLAQKLQNQIEQVIHTKTTVRDETPFTGPSGETRRYEYIFVPVLGESGSVTAVAGSTRNITARAKAEEMIQHDRQRWRELLRKAPAAIAVLRGPQHCFEWVNDDYVQLIGRPAEAILGKPVIDAVPEVETQTFLNLLNRVYETGLPFVGHELLLKLDDGKGALKELYVNFVYTPTTDLNGEIDGIFVHATDVTRLVTNRKQVEESERQFRTLAETIPHLAWMADETGNIFWYNRRWYDYTGMTLSEMEGWKWHKVHDPKILPEVLERWNNALAKGEPMEMTFPLRRADGQFRSFLTRVEPVKDVNGKVQRWFGTNTDITDQQKTEDELRRMNRELEEFAYASSHDLQEPLRMVNIYTQLLLKRFGQQDQTATKYADFIRQGVTRMEMLLRDLLTFSRTVHTEESIGNSDLQIALNEALSDLQNRIDETGAVIVAEPLPLARGDTAQMVHVFQNLLSNALKYRRPDIPVEIRISVAPDGDFWTVSVQDNGIGFEPRYAEHIFGLFKRLHKQEYPGTGLGLAICKRIVERYGGCMWAEGEVNRGATFKFSLPLPQ